MEDSEIILKDRNSLFLTISKLESAIEMQVIRYKSSTFTNYIKAGYDQFLIEKEKRG